MKGLSVLCALTLVLAVCTLAAAPAPKARKAPRPTPAKGATKSQPITALGPPADDADLTSPGVSAQAMSRVRAFPNRSTVVTSLLGHAPTRSKVESLATSKGMAGRQLRIRSLSGALLRNARVTSGTSVVETALSGLPEYDELDWYTGMLFTPRVPSPQFREGTRAYRLAILSCDGVRTGGYLGLPEMYQQNVLRMDTRADSEIRLSLDMPPGPGTYAATIKLMARTGQTFRDWLGSVSLESRLSCAVSTGTISGAAPDPSIALLSDGSGAVAMFTAAPADFGYPPDNMRQLVMRRINCKVQFKISGAWIGEDLLFGGIKIEKL